LLEQDFPWKKIGPEPTTDNFHIIDYTEEEGKGMFSLLMARNLSDTFSSLEEHFSVDLRRH
jgi:hypothetical protein